jgi:transketolase
MHTVNMRSQFVKTMTDLISSDPKAVLLLGDIGVHGFRHLLQNHADRAYNIGILEQATIGLAAGMAMNDLIPVFHTIAPFIVERAYEQLKVDFGYQNLNGCFVSVGASYDYAGLGCTHHCPADIGVLKLIPNMSIICPGTAIEFDTLFKEGFRKEGPKYFRLSEVQNEQIYDVRLGQANVVQQGRAGLVIAVGPMLSKVMQACAGLDASIIYYTSIAPFDGEVLKHLQNPTGRIVVCEPYYSEGGLAVNIMQVLEGKKIAIKTIGVPTVFSTNYGTAKEHDAQHSLDVDSMKKTIHQFLG